MHNVLQSKMFLVGSLMAGVLLAAPFAHAEEIVIFKSVPSAEEISDVLFGKDETSSDGPRVRSIRVNNSSSDAVGEKTRAVRMHNSAQDNTPAATPDVAGSGSEPKPIAAAPSAGVGLGFNLQFAFDSVELLSESKAYIDRLGEVLGNPENKGKPVLIVGHTDGSGAETYNAQLSERRAVAVRDYLTTTWNIDGSLLQTEGAGESQVLDGTDPLDGINRRVEFFALN